MPQKIKTRKGEISYNTVAERINMLVDKTQGNYSVITEILPGRSDEQWIVRATITYGGNTYVGHAIESQSDSGVNKTSPGENAETSAVGRALAFAGFGGDEIASANEVEIAKAREAQMDWEAELKRLYDRIEAGETFLLSEGMDQAQIDTLRNEHWGEDPEHESLKDEAELLDRYLKVLGEWARQIQNLKNSPTNGHH